MCPLLFKLGWACDFFKLLGHGESSTVQILGIRQKKAWKPWIPYWRCNLERHSRGEEGPEIKKERGRILAILETQQSSAADQPVS